MRKIIGTINGDYFTSVTIDVYDTITNTHVGTLPNAGTTFSVDVDTVNPCLVTLTPDIGIGWIANQTWGLGDKCFPTTTVPYYYECVGAGLGGKIEPVFTDNTFVRFYDNQAIWRLVQRIPTPKVRYPVTPQ